MRIELRMMNETIKTDGSVSPGDADTVLGQLALSGWLIAAEDGPWVVMVHPDLPGTVATGFRFWSLDDKQKITSYYRAYWHWARQQDRDAAGLSRV